MKSLFYIFILFNFFYSVYAEENKNLVTEIKTKSPYELVIEKATKENKTVMLLFTGLDWCPPCQEFQRSIISTKAFIEFSNKDLVFMTLNFPSNGLGVTPENHALKQRYGVNGFPTIIMTDEKGLPFQKFNYHGQLAEDFIKDTVDSIKKKNAKIKFLNSKDEDEKAKISREHLASRMVGENYIFYADLIAYGILQNKELKAEEKITQLNDLFLYSGDSNFIEMLTIEFKKLDPEKKLGTARLFMIKEFEGLLIAQNDEKTYEYFKENKTKFKGEDIAYLYQFAMMLNERNKTKQTIEILEFLLTDEDLKKNADVLSNLTAQLEELKKSQLK